jgi:probable O-glycosylation ligase (exosortase A-associated)
VFGPAGSNIQENNALAVAVLMIIPLMVYVRKFPPYPWVQKIMPFCIFFSLASVIGSQSRGAVLAILAVGAFYWWKSKSKLVTAIIFAMLTTIALVFMPESWHERVDSISEYQEDSSSMERIRAWQYSIAIASDRITGGGFGSWSLENYYKYEIPATRAFVAHSIYFSVLNDAGWPGLLLFLLILLMIWLQLRNIIKLTANDEERADYHFLAKMLQISIVAFMSGGAFLSLSYFDLAWHFMAITVALNQLAKANYQPERLSLRGSRVPPQRQRGRARAPAKA